VTSAPARDHQSEHASRRAAIASIAAMIGCSSDGETLRNWVRQTERVDMAFALTAAVCHLIRLLKVLAKPVVA